MFMHDFLFPVAVAIAAYLLVDKLGEWKRRRMYSRLGVVVIDELQEEVQIGIDIMSAAEEGMTATVPVLSNSLLPNKSWNGMPTLSDNVLLRIVESSVNFPASKVGFHPKDSRRHCKNYFDHMCANYNEALKSVLALSKSNQEWRLPLQSLISPKQGKYIEAAKKVHDMLEAAKGLLNENSTAYFPK